MDNFDFSDSREFPAGHGLIEGEAEELYGDWLRAQATKDLEDADELHQEALRVEAAEAQARVWEELDADTAYAERENRF